ncbi:hypothetical protein [Streptomyces sp. I05A-00742]|uniref:hypothetical protein n=1 Tax=Streptomyces sp. I05A-00742 TaxID=2732853 RepID=UPI001489EEE7|nr:hypothetical protein [Streptomyces sp. I05A-00742]
MSGPFLIRRLRSEQLFVDETYAFRIIDPETLEEFEPDYSATGLVDVNPEGGAASVRCAEECQFITVTAETWDGPPAVETDGWDDVAEVSVRWNSHAMEVGESDPEESGELPEIIISGPGTYRIRVSGRNRDYPAWADLGEEYLVQAWPAGMAPTVVHKSTSELAAGLRGGG